MALEVYPRAGTRGIRMVKPCGMMINNSLYGNFSASFIDFWCKFDAVNAWGRCLGPVLA